MSDTLLAVDELKVEFHTRDGSARAVDGVSFTVERGETLAILGESGSGKSVTAQAIMGILDTPPAEITGGSVKLRGRELIGLEESEYRKVRGKQIAMIFQDALSALNPVISVGEQISEMFRIHEGLSKSDAKTATIDVLKRVKIPGADVRYGNYPHEFSGGMRQRIMIAMMIALKPAVLIADEPTTALDVTVQAQIMDLLSALKEETQMGLILITHDLGVVADVAQKVMVMYSGRTFEQGPINEIYTHTANPYTRGLLESIPKLDERIGRLPAIKGLPPSLFNRPKGCLFNPRCPQATDQCRDGEPDLVFVQPDHGSRCWFAQEVFASDIKH